MSCEIKAQTIDEYIEMLKESLPQDISDEYENVTLGKNLPDFSDMLDALLSAVKDNISRPIRMLCALLVVIIISAVYHSLSGFLKNEGIAGVFDTVCNICIALSVFYISFESIEYAQDFLSVVGNFSLALSPLLTAVCLASGNVTEATVTGSGLMLFVSVCEKVFSDVLLPITKICLSLSLCSSVSSDFPDMSGIIKFFKSVFKIIISFAMMLFSAVLSYQSFVASAADNLASKTVKFTVGNAIPIVGSSVGEAMRTVAGSLSLLKSTIGGVGVSAVLLLVIPCVVSLLLDRTALALGVAVSRAFGCKKESELLDSVLSVYGHATAVVCCASVMLIFILSLFASTAASMGGV